MSQIVTQNPGSSEIQSPLVAGITEGLNKLSAVLNLKTGTLEDVQLTAVSIDSEEKNKNRIYEANFGNRLWLSSPAPVIKKNGSEITQSGSNFTIDYIGGSITFSADSKPADGDTITVSATYIIAESDALNAINTALSAVQTQSSKYKGNYDNVGALQLAHASAQNGDYAIVFDPLAVYAWKNDGWYDTRSIEDLSDYYNKEETNNLLGQKEPTIQQKGSSASDDDFYWGGRKTWQDFKEKVRSTVLTGLSTASDAAVSATDTLLVAVGKLQAQVSKATQRAYLTGTGAPSTSTVGAVGQRYVNTSNGDEYTCEEVSGDTYTWRLHTRSVNGKRPTTPGGNIELEAADVGAEVAGTGISTYTCTTSGSVHALSGKGNNIKFVADAPFNDGDTITVNEEPVTAKTQDGEELSGGAWASGSTVVCYLDGSALNFKGGSGKGVNCGCASAQLNMNQSSYTSSIAKSSLEFETENGFSPEYFEPQYSAVGQAFAFKCLKSGDYAVSVITMPRNGATGTAYSQVEINGVPAFNNEGSKLVPNYSSNILGMRFATSVIRLKANDILQLSGKGTGSIYSEVVSCCVIKV